MCVVFRCKWFARCCWLPLAAGVVLLLLVELRWLRWVRPPERRAVSASSGPVAGGVGLTSLPASSGPPAGAVGLTSLPASSGPARPLLVLHWTERPAGAAAAGVQLRLGADSFSECASSNCHGTGDRDLLSRADAVLFHGRLVRLDDLPRRRRPHQLFVFVLRESPQSTRLPLKRLDNFFNLTMTYSRHADVVFPYGQTAPGEQRGKLPFFHRR